MTYVVGLGAESMFAAVVLAIIGWRGARRHAAAALCLSAAFIGMLASFSHRH